MNDDELISRHLSGDLSEAQAVALARRLADEPALTARKHALEGWLDTLEDLDDAAPPPALDAQVLGVHPPHAAVSSPTASPRPLWAASGWLVAAAALAGLWQPIAPTQLRVADDTIDIEGRNVLALDGVELDIDGTVQVKATTPTLEASSSPWTLDVRAGRATVQTGDTPAQTLERGAQWRWPVAAAVPSLAAAAPTTSSALTQAQRRNAMLDAENRQLRDRIAMLEASLEQSEIVGAFARGQLVSTTGDAVPWPNDVAVAMEPGELTERVYAAAEDMRDVWVEDVDCDEYPCIALLRLEGGSEDARKRVDPIVQAASQGVPDGSASVFSSRLDSIGGEVVMVGIAVAPSYHLDRDSEIGTRVHFRANTLTMDLAREVVGP